MKSNNIPVNEKIVRKVLEVNNSKLLGHLRVIASYGINEQGSEMAIDIGTELLYYRTGNKKTPLSRQEVGELIHQ
jgi:hypothetical protein